MPEKNETFFLYTFRGRGSLKMYSLYALLDADNCKLPVNKNKSKKIN